MIFYSTVDQSNSSVSTRNSNVSGLAKMTADFNRVSSDERKIPSLQLKETSEFTKASDDDEKNIRRCIVRVNRERGLGFVLSANGDFDHTISKVEKVCINLE